MRRRFWLGLLLAVLALGSLCAGRYGSSLSDIARALLFSSDELTQSLVWNLRMPRILLVSISGAALAVSGVVYQTIFRNPLASGDVIGASSGCSLGAVFAILFYQESWFIELCAFLTGMLLVILTFLLASRVRGNRILNLVVAGLILQAVATSLMSLSYTPLPPPDTTQDLVCPLLLLKKKKPTRLANTGYALQTPKRKGRPIQISAKQHGTHQ